MSTSKGSILLTGANGGIGVGIATEITRSSYGITHETIYVVRDPTKAVSLKAVLEHAPKDHKHEVLPLDLSSLGSVRYFADDINKRIAGGDLPPLQAVILNAGVQDVSSQKFTTDGMERTFEVNYLSNFLLVLLLLRSMDRQHGRIIFIGSTTTKLDRGPQANMCTPQQRETLISSTANMAKGIEEHPDGSVYKAGMRAYAMSKLLMMMFMYELQHRLNDDPSLSNISILGFDPGWVAATAIFRDQTFWVIAVMLVLQYLAPLLCLIQQNPLFRTPSKSGKDILRACFDKKDVGEYPKAVYIDGTVVKPTPQWANDKSKQKELWNGSLGLTGIKERDTVLKNWK